MPLNEKAQSPFENHILRALPRAEYARLSPHMEPVRLAAGRTLYEAGESVRHAYFPRGGMISLISATEGGAAVEVGMVGSEGMAGLPAVLRNNVTPYRVVVQLQANAVRVPARVIRAEFDRGGVLQDLLLRYTHTLVTQLSQSAACNRLHSMRARLCRWLLVSQDRAQSDSLDFTQEFLSQMIGAPRSRVALVAGSLRRSGIISYGRGRIRVLDRPRLEAASCECYRIVRDEMSHFLAA